MAVRLIKTDTSTTHSSGDMKRLTVISKMCFDYTILGACVLLQWKQACVETLGPRAPGLKLWILILQLPILISANV